MSKPSTPGQIKAAAREALREEYRQNLARMKTTPARGSNGVAGKRTK